MVRSYALLRLAARPAHLRQHVVDRRTIFSPSRRNDMRVLGIETSADDTCVALMSLRKNSEGADLAHVYASDRVTCANQKHGGIHPVEAVVSHTQNLSRMVSSVISKLPEAKPDLICVTRGPGMGGCLSVGVTTAKALSDAWGVPIVGVHHMQAHALTPAMGEALRLRNTGEVTYPFLTLLVSGKHTMLVHTKSPVNHRILAQTKTTALGDVLDKIARELVPLSWIETQNDTIHCCYPQIMELKTAPLSKRYMAPQTRQGETYQSDYGWRLHPPLRETKEMKYDFTALCSSTLEILRAQPEMSDQERMTLANAFMCVAFQHLMSRVITALETDEDLVRDPPKYLVLSGGVARNALLRTVVEQTLAARGFNDIELRVPRRHHCTDNAEMIAYTGWKMYTNGWQSEQSFCPVVKWSIEEILSGVDCWVRRPGFPPITPEDAQSRNNQHLELSSIPSEDAKEEHAKTEDRQPSPANKEVSSVGALVMPQIPTSSFPKHNEAFPGAALFFPSNPRPFRSDGVIDETFELPGEDLEATNLTSNVSEGSPVDKPSETPDEEMDEADLQLERILEQAEMVLERWDSGSHDTSTRENSQAALGTGNVHTTAAHSIALKRDALTPHLVNHHVTTSLQNPPLEGQFANDKVEEYPWRRRRSRPQSMRRRKAREARKRAASLKNDGASKGQSPSASDQAPPREENIMTSITTNGKSADKTDSHRIRPASLRADMRHPAAQAAKRDDAAIEIKPAKAPVPSASDRASRPIVHSPGPWNAGASKVWQPKPPAKERHVLKIHYIGFADEPTSTSQKSASSFVGRLASLFGLGRK